MSNVHSTPDARTRCTQLLRNAGIAPEPFLEKLENKTPPVPAYLFLGMLEKAIGDKNLPVENDPKAALMLRGIFLESKDPIKTDRIFLKMAAMREGKGMTQAAGFFGLAGNARQAFSHYTGLGVGGALSAVWDMRRFILVEVDNQPDKWLPKVNMSWRKEDTGFNDKVFEVAEKQLDRLLGNVTPTKYQRAAGKINRFLGAKDPKGTAAVDNLGEFLSIDSSSLRSVVQAVKNVMQDPESRALILEKFKNQTTGHVNQFLDQLSPILQDDKQRAEMLEAINATLQGHKGFPISEEMLRERKNLVPLLTNAITKKYNDNRHSNKVSALLEDIKSSQNLSNNHPFITQDFIFKEIPQTLNEEAVATMLREALSVTAELHQNEYNIQRISQMISLLSTKHENEENKAEFLAQYWEKAEVARQRAENKGQTSAKAQPDAVLTPQEPGKIAFVDKPEVNLGAAIVSVGLGKWISNVLSHKTKDAEGKEHPPSGWKKAAKWLVILGLTAVTTAAVWRAGTLQRSDGTSWVERAFDPKLAESVRQR